jgi:polysaccharide biosynthesis protein PslG
MRRAAPLLIALLAVIALPAPAGARILVGLGDQHAATFGQPRVRALHLHTARLVLAWDWYRDGAQVAATDAWMQSVRGAGLRPLISFNRNWRRSGLHRLPSLAQYRESFLRLRARYPDVVDFGAWNEANHKTQPLAHKPRAAARYFNVLRAACPRCTIVAADVLDDPSMPAWIATFARYAHHPRVWGLHNYRDANRATGSTAGFLRLVKGQVWLTETGGIRRSDHGARGSRLTRYRKSLTKQAMAVRRVFALARSSPRIKRVYFYQWQRQRHALWDSAFLNADGSARPALRVLRAELRR